MTNHTISVNHSTAIWQKEGEDTVQAKMRKVSLNRPIPLHEAIKLEANRQGTNSTQFDREANIVYLCLLDEMGNGSKLTITRENGDQVVLGTTSMLMALTDSLQRKERS